MLTRFFFRMPEAMVNWGKFVEQRYRACFENEMYAVQTLNFVGVTPYHFGDAEKSLSIVYVEHAVIEVEPFSTSVPS